MAEAPGVRTALTSDAANRHAHRIRAEVDAIGVGVGTVLVDDPLLTARGAYRERPLTPRHLRPAAADAARRARALDTRRRPCHHRHDGRGRGPGGRPRRARGPRRGDRHRRTARFAPALQALGARGDQLAAARRRRGDPRGGLGRAASSITSGCTSRRTSLGPGGVQFLNGRRVFAARPDRRANRAARAGRLMEGYVHGPR